MVFKQLLLLILFVVLQGCSDTDDSQYLYMPSPPQERVDEPSTPVVENSDMAAVALSLAESGERVVEPVSKPVITPVVIAEDAPVKPAAKVIEPVKITPPPAAKTMVAKSPEPQKTVVSVAPPAKVVEKKRAAPTPQVVVKKEPVVKKPVSPEPVKVAKVVEAKKTTPPVTVQAAAPPVVATVKVAAMPLELTHAKDNPMASHDSVYTFFERNRFQKLDGEGKPLPDSADAWACVKDKVNGEVWEAKTDGKNRNKLYTYVINGSAGQCGAESCLADDYVKRVNASALCGFTNWRVPSRGELLKVVYFEHPEGEPTADIRYFINTQKERYLTSTDFEYGVGRMITVDFESGYDKSHKGDEPAYLRLLAR